MKRKREEEVSKLEIKSAIEELSLFALNLKPSPTAATAADVHVPIKPFISLCNLLIQILDKIWPTMAVFRQDIQRNIQGIGILLDGLFGTATGLMVSVENIGLLGSTRVRSRRVIQISAGFMIFFSILGKFGALFASINTFHNICSNILRYMFGLVASVGLSFLQFTNMNSMRNLFIVGVSLFLRLSIPEYFREFTTADFHGLAHTKAGWVSYIV